MSATAAASVLEAIAACLERGDAAAAEARARQALAAYPGDIEVMRLLGIALLLLGRAAEARGALEAALACAPEHAALLANLANVCLTEGDPDAAVDLLRRAIRAQPRDAALQNNLGNALRTQGDDAAAREAYLAALAVAPNYLNAALNLAAVELALGRVPEAEARLRALLAARPHPQAWLLLGHALRQQHRFADAQQAYTEGAALAPGAATFPYHAGLAADEQRHFAEAARLYRRALELDPGLHAAEGQLLFVLRREYDWPALAPLSRRIRARALDGSGEVDPFAFLAEDADAAEQLACARARAATIERKAAPTRQRLAFTPALRRAGTPLRIGFVSAGFGAHPTALLTAEVFEHLGQRSDLAVHLYATTPDDGSAMRERLRRAVHGFHEVALQSAATLAAAIHADGIDVLVDVDGWCADGSPEVFALRPAPVQVAWLAYPGTSGAPWMDWLIADRFVVPEAARRFYSEQIAYLPGCYQPSDTTRVVGAAPARADCGLPDGVTVFASFNLSWKLNAASFARMCRVLAQVPDSVLWLLAAGDGADARLRAAARAHGIDPRRLVFAPKLPPADHLARLQCADLLLDCNPYNAHTTASDAIWAGCPVLTRPGDTFASRVAGSLNHHLGLPELNAADDDGFIAIATRLGNDRTPLARLHTRLAERRERSALFDMPAYARDFAALLQALRPHELVQPP